MTLNPKKSGEFIVQHAKYLTVQELGIKNLSNQVIFRLFFDHKHFLCPAYFCVVIR